MTQLQDSQKSNLCSVIRTTGYSRKVVSLLRDVASNLFKLDSGNVLESLSDLDLKQVLDNSLEDIDRSDVVKTEEKIIEIINFLKSIEEVKFVIPIYPEEDFVKIIHKWCSENINQNILLDITTNRLMESGFLMIYKGHYIEYSLENLLDDYFANHSMESYINSSNETKNDNKGL